MTAPDRWSDNMVHNHSAARRFSGTGHSKKSSATRFLDASPFEPISELEHVLHLTAATTLLMT
ncbi:unnamed protein product, partial [Larinioides sclopetarius]